MVSPHHLAAHRNIRSARFTQDVKSAESAQTSSFCRELSALFLKIPTVRFAQIARLFEIAIRSRWFDDIIAVRQKVDETEPHKKGSRNSDRPDRSAAAANAATTATSPRLPWPTIRPSCGAHSNDRPPANGGRFFPADEKNGPINESKTESGHLHPMVCIIIVWARVCSLREQMRWD